MGYASQLGTFSVTIKKKFVSLSIPIMIISVLSGLCSIIIFGYFNSDASGGGGPPPATPIQGDTPGIAALNALFYVGIAFIGAFAIFLVFKFGKIKLLKAFFAVAVGITSFFFVFLLIYSAPYFFLDIFLHGGVFQVSTDWIILSIAIVVGLAYAIFTVVSMVYTLTSEPISQVMAMLFAVLAGTFLATFLPMLASIFIMIGLSIYDIISVFKGPIKKIAEVSDERENAKYQEVVSTTAITDDSNETEFTVKIEDTVDSPEPAIDTKLEDVEYEYSDYIELGLGDLAFFGMLFSFALIRLGFFSAIGAFIGVVVGAIGTIKLLEKVKMMPGLPLSIGLGLILAFGIWGIFALAGYSGWGWISPEWLSLAV